jgi:hypothetical protein
LSTTGVTPALECTSGATPVPLCVWPASATSTSATIAASSAKEIAQRAGWRRRHGSRRLAGECRVRSTAVTSPVVCPERAVSIASASSMSEIMAVTSG